MDTNLTRWTRRCAICGLLGLPLLVYHVEQPTSCNCTPRYVVEQQGATTAEQPDAWPEVLRVIPEQSSGFTGRTTVTQGTGELTLTGYAPSVSSS